MMGAFTGMITDVSSVKIKGGMKGEGKRGKKAPLINGIPFRVVNEGRGKKAKGKSTLGKRNGRQRVFGYIEKLLASGSLFSKETTKNQEKPPILPAKGRGRRLEKKKTARQNILQGRFLAGRRRGRGKD